MKKICAGVYTSEKAARSRSQEISMRRMHRWIAGGLMALTLTACQAPANNGTVQSPTPMELKIYDVPPAQTGNLLDALTVALASDKARISAPSPGKLLVYAPRDAQASISTAIATLGHSSPNHTTEESLRVHFWVVDAQPGNGSDDPTLTELSSALNTLRQSIGPMHFNLSQSASAVTTSGRSGSIQTGENGGPLRQFNFETRKTDGHDIDLQVNYNDSGANGLAAVNTRILAQPGQYILLAQAPGACATAPSEKIEPTCPSKPAMRLLVVSVDRMNPTN